MEVRKGYKQTDIGVVPEDWSVTSLGSLCEISAGGDLVKSDYSPIQDDKFRFPIYSNALTNKGLYGYSKTFQYEGNKITVTARGDVGHATYRDDKFCAIGRVLVLSAKRSCDLRIVTEFINNFVEFAFESTGVPQLTAPQISKYVVAIPPTLAEQEAIAEALSDADALIESLETLLAKKRQVKQGAMSELLTGKRRLSGFSGEWEVKKLGDVFEITAGGDFDPTQSSAVQDERFPYPIYSNALTDEGLYGFSSYNNHQAGSITVTARGTLGNANYRDHDFTAIGRVIVLKPIQPVDCLFISEFINNRIKFVVESTGVPQLTAPQISKYEIPFPEFAEQIAIAEILSDMDAEISALEGKLVKARQVKAGMMSELLTGKIRLNHD